jgi:hypothetical protein
MEETRLNQIYAYLQNAKLIFNCGLLCKTSRRMFKHFMISVISLVEQNSADINSKEGNTLLHLVCFGPWNICISLVEQTNLIMFMLERGADPNHGCVLR